jgi:putative transposase
LIKMLVQQHNYPVAVALRVWSMTPSSYYYQARCASQEEVVVRSAIEQLAGEWPSYGYRRVAAQLGRPPEKGGYSLQVNRKRVQRLMRQMGLQAHRPERKVRTTDSTHSFPRFPNLVEGLEVERPDQVWVGDITYVRLLGEFVYLAVLMDVFTRSIRGWHLGRSLDGELTVMALRRALLVGAPEIHHSDQGVQYAAGGYVEMLQGVGTAVSMADVGEAWQNGYAERLMRTIKEEEVALSEYTDYNDAYRQIGRFLDEVYQHKRIHSSLGYLTPVEFEQSWQSRQLRFP